ncbi:hypothetical protein M409DRAFT_30394 [Zasmidium cellare ATCC 36951]|uniref:N-acetyltransferase domain-containing protein n=1 Tax=Zasmidium cellare ATCC 36951 TaxID=1080233 RepID=A0A6A6BX03_ZASCE|nr:uncharacterized protein M409DRAFT_30394 [Zasmidium cellare ATCC 36951]KAF2159113.1 hypothetical protein M409DRAFT_30394 [Zasmidium cellare ATCC 36951]
MKPTVGSVVKLPKLKSEDYNESNDIARTLAEKTRSLRLYALKTAPDAFASSYEDEVQRDLTHTLDRLGTHNAAHFFAVDRAIDPWAEKRHNEFFAELFSAKFVGSMVIVGPLARESFSAKKGPLSVGADRDSTRGKEPSSEPSHYILNGTFVDPEARRSGFGRRLIEAALATGQEDASNRGYDFLCTVLVDSENVAAQALYEKAGFSVSGEEKYVQRPRAQMGESKSAEGVAIKLELRRALAAESKAL